MSADAIPPTMAGTTRGCWEYNEPITERQNGNSGSGVLRASFAWGTVEKQIEAGLRQRPVVVRRVSSSAELRPGERRMRGLPVAWAEIDYPDATVPLFGIGLHWLVAFLLFSTVAALLLRRRFGVVV
jgi:hypothetical protein